MDRIFRIKLSSLVVAIAIISILISCSAKRNIFLKAQDYPHPVLPKNAVEQTPDYYVPPKSDTENNIIFVNRPRPLPEFIGSPPATFVEAKIESRHQYTQIYSLGYNTYDEASLFITPHVGDISNLESALQQLGMNKKKQKASNQPIEEYRGRGLQTITLYKYHDSLMISANLPKKRNKKNEYDYSEDFKLMDDLRELFLNIES